MASDSRDKPTAINGPGGKPATGTDASTDKTRAPSTGGGAPAGAAPPAEATMAPTPASASKAAPTPSADRATQVVAKKPTRAAGSGGRQPSDDPVVGTELGGYEIIRKLAEGGMGVVYEGRHVKLGRRGALKLLKLEFCQSDEVVERFHQEARAVNEIHHENIVDIYDFGRDGDGRAFFVMEFLEGESLAARLRKGVMPWSDAFPVLEQTLRALEAAHEKGFVHRDLKPDNIWLRAREDGAIDVRLLDFGIAKLVGLEGAQEKLTRTGAIIGTPDYMSPEQINGAGTVDARTDIYSMGVIVHELFTGQVPFPGETVAAIMAGHLFNEPPRLVELPERLGVPEKIADVADRMLAKNVDERYQRVADVRSDLRALAQNRVPTIVSSLDQSRPRTSTKATTAPGRGAAAARGKNAPTTPEAAEDTATAGRRPGARPGWLLPAIAVLGLVGAAVAAVVVLGKPPAKPEAGAVAPGPGPAPSPGPAAEPTPKRTDYLQVRKDAQLVVREALGHAEPRVRVDGSDAVGIVRDQVSTPRLVELTGTDPDLEVRGHAAGALGLLGADSERPTLAKLEADAPPALAVWYAEALARLGDPGAKKRLVKLSGDKDLGVSFKAGLALAGVSAPGDKDAIGALTRLAAREVELADVAPYAGAVLLTRLAGLRHDKARTVLYGLLESEHEGARLAAAEGLARLGDEAAAEPLKKVLGDAASPNRLVAAVALIALGDYSGFEMLGEKLDDPDVETRRLAARGLGEIGEKSAVPALVKLLGHDDPRLRVAAAVALLRIVGLDPRLLAQSSVDWAKGALASEDWAVRRAAAGSIGDLPAADAVPLLAQAIADPRPEVRRAAARAASRLRKSPEAARALAEAASRETDPEAKEEAIKSIGSIGDPAVLPTLELMSADPGRVGVLASGSRIALGDTAAVARLDSSAGDAKVPVRLAVIEAAVVAANPIVVPALTTGVKDKVFEVRFAAAEALIGFAAEKTLATQVLTEGLAAREIEVQARAQAALTRLGAAAASGPSAAQLLDAPDARTRRAALPLLAALPWPAARPLVRRALADSDPEIRSGGLELVEKHQDAQRAEALKLYRRATEDGDPGVRARAQAKMAKIAPPLDATATAVDPTPPGPAVPDLGPVRTAADAAVAAAAAADGAAATLEAAVAELEKLIAEPTKDDDDLERVEAQVKACRAANGKLDEAVAAARAALAAADTAVQAAPSPAATGEQARATKAVRAAEARASAAVARWKAADERADDFAKSEATDPSIYVSTADTQIAAGQLAGAKRDLDKAAKLLRDQGRQLPAIHFSYGRLYDRMAKAEKDDGKKRELLGKARTSYEAFAKSGSGRRVEQAKERVEEIVEELKELGAP